MNSYQLISKLRKVRADTYLTAIDQALYYELVSICNEKGWKDKFEAKNIQLCLNLNITEKTLIKSRKLLCDAGLIYFKSCKDKRIGCYYSFSTVLSTGNTTVDTTVKSIGDTTAETLPVIEQTRVLSPILSTLLFTGIFPVDKNKSTVLSSGIFPVETQFSPYKRIINYKQEESLAHTHESPPPVKVKPSRKKEGDSKPLVFPFTSDRFMAAWNKLRETPKWKKKLNLALQISLDKLSKYDEVFAIEQMERAIESNWTGVVFPGTDEKYQEWLNLRNGNNRSNNPNGEKQSAGIKSVSF